MTVLESLDIEAYYSHYLLLHGKVKERISIVIYSSFIMRIGLYIKQKKCVQLCTTENDECSNTL